MTLCPLFRALLPLLLAGTAALAATPKFDAIYVFGDSYCDVGNIALSTRGLVPPSPPYFAGRFSNGPLWVEHVAGAMGLPMLPALAGGTDYAFGGAEVTADVVTPLGTIPSVPGQILTYLDQHGGQADPKALYILEGGGNDILNATGGSPEELGYRVALGLAQSEALLRAAGARRFPHPQPAQRRPAPCRPGKSSLRGQGLGRRQSQPRPPPQARPAPRGRHDLPPRRLPPLLRHRRRQDALRLHQHHHALPQRHLPGLRRPRPHPLLGRRTSYRVRPRLLRRHGRSGPLAVIASHPVSASLFRQPSR